MLDENVVVDMCRLLSMKTTFIDADIRERACWNRHGGNQEGVSKVFTEDG